MASENRAIDDFCRLCAIESRSGIVIYSAEGESLCLEEKILNCLRIEISRDDMLPKRICQSCNLLLEDYNRFSVRATQVQQTLYFLLGLHLTHPQKQDAQLCLVSTGVKVESNLIKKEFDEIIVHSGSIHIDRNKFNLLLPGDDFGKDQKEYYDIAQREAERIKDVEIEKEVIVENNKVGSRNEFKKIHPRFLLQTKANQNKGIEKCNAKKVDCIIEDYSDTNEINGETELISTEENQTDENEEKRDIKKLEFEWFKKWGIACNLCECILQDKIEFDKHYICNHNKKPKYTCSYCKVSSDDYTTYETHIFEHINSGMFKCRFCHKKFFAKEMLQIHLASLHNEMNFYICDECGKSFSSQPRLDFHQKKHKNPRTEELKCTDCGKILQTRGGLAAHKSVHKLGRHFMCHICGKTFTQKINMQQHVKHHKGERPYSCDICKKSFAEKSHLNRHRSFHTNDRPFQCPVCKKMYKTERCLKVHSQTHWNSRPFICSYCGKGFLSSTKLKQHHNCHTGERPFACKYCERTFTNYPNWLKHTRRKHKVDHKTGLSLKKELHPLAALPSDQPPNEIAEVPDSVIEFIEMPDVEVKEDGRDSVHSHHSVLNTVNQSILEVSRYPTPVGQDGSCQYQMSLLSDLVSSQTMYSSDQVIVQQQSML